MRKSNWALLAILLVALFLDGGDAVAKKGGGGNPGGGGSGGIPDADVSILYFSSTGTVFKGDDAGQVQEAIGLQTYGPSSFGPAGTTKTVFVTDTDGRGIYVSDFSGTSPTKVVGTAVHGFVAPAWSNGDAPNGEPMIAFIDRDADTGSYLLYATTLDGEVTQLNYGTEVFHPSWNPVTNDQIVVAGKYENLWLLDIGLDATGELAVVGYEELTTGTVLEGEDIGSPSFSSDGTRIVLSAAAGNGAQDVWVYETATGTFSNLTDGAMGNNDAVQPCIRKDGKVMFSAPDKGRNAVLWVMDSDGSNIGRYSASRPKHDQYHVASRR